MNAVLNVIICIVALLLMGGFATFLVFLNHIKYLERKQEREEHGETNR